MSSIVSQPLFEVVTIRKQSLITGDSLVFSFLFFPFLLFGVATQRGPMDFMGVKIRSSTSSIPQTEVRLSIQWNHCQPSYSTRVRIHRKSKSGKSVLYVVSSQRREVLFEHPGCSMLRKRSPGKPKPECTRDLPSSCTRTSPSGRSPSWICVAGSMERSK